MLYTVPALETAIVKSITIATASALATTITLKLNGTSGANTLVVETLPAAGSIRMDGLFWALQPGDILRAISASASGCFVTGFGAELEGVAD